MARDAFDPGLDGTYPAFPRLPDGSPCWSDSGETDGIPQQGVTPMPRGERVIRRGRERIRIDVTPRTPDGSPIDPPVLNLEP